MKARLQSSPFLARLSWAAWGVVGVEILLDLMNEKAFNALLAGAVTLSVRAGQIRNADRLEKIAIKRIFEIGQQSDQCARQEASASQANGHDTGPFKVYDHKSG